MNSKPTGWATGVLFSTYLFAAVSCEATLSFIGNGYAILDANGGGNNYYAVDGYNNLTFSGNPGGLTIQAGQSLLIGGQIQTYPQEFGTTAWIGYKLFQGSTLLAENDNINLAYLQPSGNNDVWQASASASGVNLDQNLSEGHTRLKFGLAPAMAIRFTTTTVESIIPPTSPSNPRPNQSTRR